MIQFDIIIPSYSQDYRALIGQIHHLRKDANVLLMENGNRDAFETPYWYRHVPMPGNIGFVKATNAGIAMSTAPYIMLLNDDTMIYTDIWENMLRRFNTEETLGIVGAISSPGFSWVAINNRREVYPEYAHLNKDSVLSDAEHEHIAKDIDRIHDTQVIDTQHMVPFFCCMIKRDVIQKVGYLSEAYGIGLGDDDDYCRRVRQAGFKIQLALDSYVFHKQRTTFKELYNSEQIATIQKTNMNLFKSTGDYYYD